MATGHRLRLAVLEYLILALLLVEDGLKEFVFRTLRNLYNGLSIHTWFVNRTHSHMKNLEMRGLLQYLVMDVMTLAPEELPLENSVVCYYTHLEELLDPNLLITYAYRICKAKGHVFCEHVFVAWMSAMRSLPSSAWSPSLLHRCLALLGTLEDADDVMRAADPDVFAREVANYQDRFQDFHDKHWPGDPFEDFLQRTFASMTIELVKEKFNAPTIEEAFCQNGNEENQRVFFWKLVGGDRWLHRRARLSGALRFGLGAELMMALIDKGLPEWCWAGIAGPYNDNLLQYIIAPISALPMDWDDEEETKGRLCICLAERFSLEELCREDERGINVFYHANKLRDFFQRPGRVSGVIWIEFHSVIVERMVQCVREFQGSLREMIELVQRVHYGLEGN